MDRIAPWRQNNWDRRAVANFAGGGTGSGLAIMAAVSQLSSGDRPWLAYLLAMVFIATGLGFVWLEIGRPWRFLHVFFNPRTSWMTREALVAPPLLAALAIVAWRGGAALAVLAVLLAVTFLYCQARILRAAMGIPAWREPLIVPLIITTGLAEGAGILTILAIFNAGGPRNVAVAVAVAAIVARWIAWTMYRRRLTERRAPLGALNALRTIDRHVLIFGTIAPLVLMAAALAFADLAWPIGAPAGLLAAAGGWLIKDTVVTRAAFNQGFALQHFARLNDAAEDSSTQPGWS